MTSIKAGKKAKIALTIQERQYGGASKQVFWLMQYLCQQGYEVILISNARDTWLGQSITQHQLPVKTFYSSWIQRAFNPFKEIGVILFILKVLWQEKPDVILLGGAKLIYQGGIAALLCNIPGRFIHLHGLGAPPGSVLLSINRFCYRLLARLGFRLITVSEFDTRFMIGDGTLQPQHIQVNHNGIDIAGVLGGDRMVLRTRFSIPQDAFVIGMVGRFSRHKRYDQFLAMLKPLCESNTQVYGLLVGDGPDKTDLHQAIDQLGLSHRVYITGFVEDMRDVYATLDLSVLLTDFEGLSNVLCESAAAGVPLIANPVCGNPEVVQHGINGFLASTAGEAAQFAQKLIDDPALRQRFALQGRQLAQDRFDAQQQIAHLVHHVLSP